MTFRIIQFASVIVFTPWVALAANDSGHWYDIFLQANHITAQEGVLTADRMLFIGAPGTTDGRGDYSGIVVPQNTKIRIIGQHKNFYDIISPVAQSCTGPMGGAASCTETSYEGWVEKQYVSGIKDNTLIDPILTAPYLDHIREYYDNQTAARNVIFKNSKKPLNMIGVVLLVIAAIMGFIAFKLRFDRTNEFGVQTYRTATGALFGTMSLGVLHAVAMILGLMGLFAIFFD